jgi:hypothetical protein
MREVLQALLRSTKPRVEVCHALSDRLGLLRSCICICFVRNKPGNLNITWRKRRGNPLGKIDEQMLSRVLEAGICKSFRNGNALELRDIGMTMSHVHIGMTTLYWLG